jgi:hypothetical protein
METKICCNCKIEKKLSEFNKDKYSLDGLRYRCRECTGLEYRKYYTTNRETEIKRQVNYQNNNKPSVNHKRNIRHKNKYDTDVLYKIKCNVRNRIKHFLKSANFDKIKNGTFNIVGCSPQELKEHIESQFQEGMNWDNHSLDGWNIDHIIPLSSAKTKEDVYKLCHYTNLQPLWSTENFKKSNKII